MPEFGDSTPLLASEVSEDEAQPFFACGEVRDKQSLLSDEESDDSLASVSALEEESDLYDDFRPRWWPVWSSEGREMPG
jgi:hypothetical protein